MFQKPLTVVLFGSSGSGKGTQAVLLRDYLKESDPNRRVIYIETGGRLREFREEANYTAGLTGNVLEEGGLLPEFMPIWIWTEYLVRNFSGNEHLILDGLSRREHEAPILESALEFYKLDPVYVLYLKTSKEWSTQRLLERDREDDSRGNISRRLDWFYENTLPAVAYLKTNPNFRYVEINGEGSVSEVHGEILSLLK